MPFSERPHEDSGGSGTTSDEGAIRSVQWPGGRLRVWPRRESHHLHRPPGILGYGVLPGGGRGQEI